MISDIGIPAYLLHEKYTEIPSSLIDDGVIKYIPPDMILPEKTKRSDTSTDSSSGSGIVKSAKYIPVELEKVKETFVEYALAKSLKDPSEYFLSSYGLKLFPPKKPDVFTKDTSFKPAFFKEIKMRTRDRPQGLIFLQKKKGK